MLAFATPISYKECLSLRNTFHSLLALTEEKERGELLRRSFEVVANTHFTRNSSLRQLDLFAGLFHIEIEHLMIAHNQTPVDIDVTPKKPAPPPDVAAENNSLTPSVNVFREGPVGVPLSAFDSTFPNKMAVRNSSSMLWGNTSVPMPTFIPSCK